MPERLKGTLLVFATVAGLAVLYGLRQGFRFGETFLAAAMFAAFVLGIGCVARWADERLKRKQ